MEEFKEGRGFAEVLSAVTPLRAGSTAMCSRQQTRTSLKVAVKLMGAGHTQNGLVVISRPAFSHVLRGSQLAQNPEATPKASPHQHGSGAADSPGGEEQSFDQFFDERIVLRIAEIRSVTENIAIPKRRAESNSPVHPIRRVSPQDRPVSHGLGKILEIPMKSKAGNHGIEYVSVHGVFQSSPQTVGRSVQPDLTDSGVDGRRQQEPDSLSPPGQQREWRRDQHRCERLEHPRPAKCHAPASPANLARSGWPVHW